jgi:RNA polymerase sigma factor for flagellar operon FliA
VSTTSETTQTASAQLSPEQRRHEERLVTDHLPLVGYVVSAMVGRLPTHVSKDELASAGLAALAHAARTWDPARGVPFARFAETRVRGAVLDELRGLDWASRSVRARARKVQASRDQLIAALGRIPTPVELATALGISPGELDTLEEDTQRAVVMSLNGMAGATPIEDMVAERAPAPEEALVDRERIGYLHDAVQTLPERLRTVVVGYFFEERQMADIATELGVSESRVSQLRAEAMVLLRDALNTQLDPALVPAPARPEGCVARRREAYFSAVAARGDVRTRLATTTYDMNPRVFTDRDSQQSA